MSAFRNRKSSVSSTSSAPLPDKIARLLQEAIWLSLGTAAAFLALILSGYHRADPGWSHAVQVERILNPGGRFGAWLSDVMLYMFGVSAWWGVLLLGYMLVVTILLQRGRIDKSVLPSPIVSGLGFVLVLVSSSSLEAIRFHSLQAVLPLAPGGVVGLGVGSEFQHQLGFTGGTLFLLLMWGIGLSLMTGMSWLGLFETVGGWFEAGMGVIHRATGEKNLHTDPLVVTPDDLRAGPRSEPTLGDAPRQEPTLGDPQASPMPADVQVTAAAAGDEIAAVSTFTAPDAGPLELSAGESATVVASDEEGVVQPPLNVLDGFRQARRGDAMLGGELADAPLINLETLLRKPAAVPPEEEAMPALTLPPVGVTPPPVVTVEPLESSPPWEAAPQIAATTAPAGEPVMPVSSVSPLSEPATPPAQEVPPPAQVLPQDVPAIPAAVPVAPVSPPGISMPAPASAPFILEPRDSTPPPVPAAVSSVPMVPDEDDLPPLTAQIIRPPIPAPVEMDLHQGELPSLELLDQPKNDFEPPAAQVLENTSRLIERRLADFGVKVTVVAAYPGPVITRYEIEPATGVKGIQIVNLAKDLARALSLISIRVVETVPGKSYMALELPNPKRQSVRIREVFASPIYLDSPSMLTVGLGKDISGVPVVADLAKMPHLLVAGTTGSGKSVGINAMILSFLYKARADQVRLILVDPKMLELSVYEGIPHLLAPVVTDMKHAANALNWCVAEMEKRYKLMAALGVRNLAGYNKAVNDARESGAPLKNPFSITPDAPEPLDNLPFIVVVIDELADLMMVVGKKIEELIARLAQKARAAGIHLILATQRPSVDVITGLIKANIPTRMSFQVSTKIDSRTILDQMGAETLLGMGDMLYLAPGTGFPTRVHGAFVSDDEVHRVVSFLKTTGAPDYVEGILAAPEEEMPSEAAETGGRGAPESDPLYDQAVDVVLRTRRPSISLVQRHLRIGYNRAARLIEDMERAGLVSSPGHNGNREVLAPPREGDA